METIALGIVQNIKDLDTQMLLGINHMHSAYWDSFMWLVTDKYVWIPLYLSLIYVIFRNHSPKAFLWCAVAIGLMILVTDYFNSQWLRPWIGR
ncbi:MAG: phospholipid phosphatase, partial [Prevotella sp.]|nr:phospholipid phosphatase [Prevotella sp.]